MCIFLVILIRSFLLSCLRAAMTPKTDFVLLIYLFYTGPFETIEYTYLGPKMIEPNDDMN
jgi:hypothetical protein